MQARGFDVRAVRPPTVPEGTARLRLSLTLNVDEAKVAELAAALAEELAKARRYDTTPSVVTGTDTDVGKTVFAAALAAALDGYYWKPVQAGLDGETDTEIVQRLSGLPSERILPEVYRLTTAASPHLAAERDGVEIDVEGLAKPAVHRPPARHRGRRRPAGAAHPELPADRAVRALGRTGRARALDARSAPSTTACCRSKPCKRRRIPLLGIAFVGDENADSERTITDMGGVRRLGRLPHLDPLDAALSARSFAANFRAADFLAPVPT